MNWRCHKREIHKDIKPTDDIVHKKLKTQSTVTIDKAKSLDKTKLKVYSSTMAATTKRWKRATERAIKEKDKRKETEKKAKLTIKTLKKLMKMNSKEIAKLNEIIQSMKKREEHKTHKLNLTEN